MGTEVDDGGQTDAGLRNELLLASIICYPDPRLAKPADIVKTPVSTEDDALIEKMKHVLDVAGGLALAAPQLGVSKRIFVVRIDRLTTNVVAPQHLVVINPVVTKSSDNDRVGIYERCLSLPGAGAYVVRPRFVEICFASPMGHVLSSGELFGVGSACFQHEMDHLDGFLYIDRLSKLSRDRALKQLER